MIDAATGLPPPRPALAALRLAQRETARHDGIAVWANELPPCGAITLRGNARDARFAAAVRHAIGIDVPVAPCTHLVAGTLDVSWIAPDEWLLLCPRRDIGPRLVALQGALQGIPHQAVDTSGGLARIEVRGKEARTVLSHCSGYDFDKLVPGRIVGTTWGASSAYVRCAGVQWDDGFVLLVRGSYADYAWRMIERAATPYGFGVHRIEDDGALRPPEIPPVALT